MVHHKGSNGTFAVLSLADLLQTASPPSRRAGGGLPGLAPVQAAHVHRRQPRHAPRDGPLPGPRHAPPPKPEGLAAVIPISQEGAEGDGEVRSAPIPYGARPPIQQEAPSALAEGASPGKMPLGGRRRPALPRTSSAVPSALGGLTSGFGMGPGVPPLPWPPAAKGRSAVAGRAAWPCPQGRTA